MAEQFDKTVNPFDAPIPGQSLTDRPGNAAWEHPPQFADPNEALEHIHGRLMNPEGAAKVAMMLETGIPVEAIARTIVFAGFMEGKFSPDVGFLILETVMKMILVIGGVAKISDLKVSMPSPDETKDLKRTLAKLKVANKKAKQIETEIGPELQQVPMKGLMAPVIKENI